MFINELEGFFGELGKEERLWVADNLEKLDEDTKSRFFNELNQAHKNKNLKPDISELKKVLEKVTGKKPKTYFWSVCMECGTEYAYTLPICPGCFKKGLECREIAVKKSDCPPPAKVIQFNKEYFIQGEKDCYSCEYSELSKCKNFGNEKWNCNELSTCKCASCCVKNKHENEKYAKENQKIKISFARPLDKEKLGRY